MEFRILGPLEVLEDGHALKLAAAKQRALLAVLLLERNRVVSADRLVDALWGEDPPETARKALQVHVSQLRKLLGRGRLETQAGGYLLRVEPSELDLERFERLRGEHRLREALALWRGPPLEEFELQQFAQAEIARLEELRLACLEERVERDLSVGDRDDVVGELEGLVRDHPLRERLRGLLMLALYRSGRQAEALNVYQDARRTLVEELGIEPRKALRDLHLAILNQDPALELGTESDSPVEPPRSAFVGREAELATLAEGVDDVFAGRGRLILLVGEPGIGKSRLAEEVIAQARRRGARVLVGRCWEAGGAPAYWPWVQSLRSYVRATSRDVLRDELGSGAPELAQIMPELREFLPDLPQPSLVDSEGARFRLFEAACEFLRKASQRCPLVLFLDDLHAADAPSLLLLQFLARELASARLLVLGACRDVDPTPGRSLTAMLAEVAREPTSQRLSLRGLSEREVSDYVELTASDIASPVFAAALYEETEGNPLFVAEMVRLLALEGRSPAERPIAIPQTVRDVISRRLTHLSVECNRMLVQASVLGREFSIAALSRLAGQSDDELLETLDEAMTARVISEISASGQHLRFAHVLIRDTLYDGLTTARRVRLHRQVIEALESLYGDESGPHLAELAHHSIAGSSFDKGLRYAQRAGDRALALLAYEEAARLYRTALEVLELAAPKDEKQHCQLLLSVGEAEIRAGNTPAAKDAFVAAAGIARRLSLPRELARAAIGYGGRIVWSRAGDDDRLVPLLEEALASLGAKDLELKARLLARLSGARRDDRSRERRDALSGEAVQLARRTGSTATLAYALDARASAIIAPDTVDECLELAGELAEIAGRSGDRERLVAAHHHRVIAQLLTGDPRAELDHAAAARIADELRQPAQLWQACANRSMLALGSGRLDEADALMAEALALGERTQPGAAIPIYRLHRYMLCDFRGCLAEIEPAIRELVADYPARPVFRCVLAHTHTRLGRNAEAKQTLDDFAQDNFSLLPFDQEWLFGMSLLAETCALLSDASLAPVVYQLLLPWEEFNAVDVGEGIRGSVSRYLAQLATTSRQWDDAERHFENALKMNATMRARPWLARTQSDYAGMLLTRDGDGDEARANDLQRAALATYAQLGMEPSPPAPPGQSRLP